MKKNNLYMAIVLFLITITLTVLFASDVFGATKTRYIDGAKPYQIVWRNAWKDSTGQVIPYGEGISFELFTIRNGVPTVSETGDTLSQNIQPLDTTLHYVKAVKDLGKKSNPSDTLLIIIGTPVGIPAIYDYKLTQTLTQYQSITGVYKFRYFTLILQADSGRPPCELSMTVNPPKATDVTIQVDYYTQYVSNDPEFKFFLNDSPTGLDIVDDVGFSVSLNTGVSQLRFRAVDQAVFIKRITIDVVGEPASFGAPMFIDVVQ